MFLSHSLHRIRRKKCVILANPRPHDSPFSLIFPDDALLADHEAVECNELLGLCEMAESLYEDSESCPDALLCPSCKRNWMVYTPTDDCGGGHLACKCGIQLRIQDGARGIDFLRNRLSSVFMEHRSLCAQDPSFETNSQGSGTAVLYGTCHVCGFYRAVL
mmetsp:Transcript_55282/g.75536  ORF Transcript_55282/g.75536 Transcript_55282/m.75536 type:complete len:161 (-) Transcript_55282:875-1357(-)